MSVCYLNFFGLNLHPSGRPYDSRGNLDVQDVLIKR